MPKTNDGGGATYAGYTGIVEHAGGRGSTRPGGLSELDPERSVDGTLLEGEHPDHDDTEERDPAGLVADPTGVEPIERSEDNADGEEHADDPAKRTEEEQPSEEQRGDLPRARAPRGAGRRTQK